ncbi:cholesterol 7-desaturase nvd isoform X4 [Drosophila albomicans]|uniref:cholesterol 7-desaturase n=1 Tax=Drosophila albomicans TaxID=7291 RepID=A0A9C6T2F9_DROAB|nr:cholesterol 7-desaturase nvd isoform X4 [Drosophila albomicans]
MFKIVHIHTYHLDRIPDCQILKTEKNIRNINKKMAINRLKNNRSAKTKDLPPPYPNGWYGVLESSMLSAGKSMYISCLGQHFAVYRTQAHKVYVLDTYCPHLGANMGLSGRVVGDNIECPFHKWSFRGIDGRCTNIPYSSCVPSAIKVKKWISTEVNDHIFIWYNVEDLEQPWTIPISDELQTKQFVYQGRNEFYVNCHIQEIPENGADLAHFAAIHKKSFMSGCIDAKENFLTNFARHDWKASWSATEDKHIAEVKLCHYIVLFNKFKFFKINVTGKQLGPSYVHLFLHSPIFGSFQIFQTITPVEPLLQKVVHRFYAPRLMAPIVKILICGESIMFERDMNIWDHKIYRGNPQLIVEDSSVKKFRKWYSNFYSVNSDGFNISETLQW